jgi:hypothetical protein
MQELLQQIHRRWEADPQLTAVVPAERFTTAETYHLPPYVVLQIGPEDLLRRSTHGYLRRFSLAVRIVCEELAEAEALARAIFRTFEGWQVDLSASRRLLGLGFHRVKRQPREEGSWEVILEGVALVFCLLVEDRDDQPRGAEP